MYLRLGCGELGGAALGGGGELGGLGLGPIELRGEGGVALLEEGAGLLGGDRGGVRLGTGRVYLASELADGGVGPLGDGGRVAGEEPELLVGDEQRHRRGLGIRRPDPIPSPATARGVYEGSRVCRPPLGARSGGGGGREEAKGVEWGEAERRCGTRSGVSRDFFFC